MDKDNLKVKMGCFIKEALAWINLMGKGNVYGRMDPSIWVIGVKVKCMEMEDYKTQKDLFTLVSLLMDWNMDKVLN